MHPIIVILIAIFIVAVLMSGCAPGESGWLMKCMASQEILGKRCGDFN